jgi:uncharacterized protein YecT (DUF1311 family)
MNNPQPTQGEMNECAANKAHLAQQELDLLLESIKEHYPLEFWQKLEANQLEWQILKEKDCEWTASIFDGGSMQPMVYWGCVDFHNLQRTKFIVSSICLDQRYSNIQACNNQQ